MTDYAISVIIPIRNRAGIRLRNCLSSLRHQTSIDPAQVEIIISDFGSTPPHVHEIAALADEFCAIVVRTETEGDWNRSSALNRGIDAARAPVTFCTDADMIFESNFLSVLLNEISKFDGRAMAVSRCGDLPDLGQEREWKNDEYPLLKTKANLRTTCGTGACQATLTEWFRKVGGYDEKYIFWGFEDSDMFYRARKDGLTICQLHGKTSMLHQYHTTTRNDRLVRKWRNKLRYYLTRGRVIKKRPSSFAPR